tara:strand:+ start:1338 stop:3644 length:2307 start_codon:yes stop_codon:yes gene_type:complete
MSLLEDQEKFNNTLAMADQINQQNDDYMLRKTRSYLFMDDDARLEYLASERFPNDPFGALRYKIDDSGNIQYDSTGNGDYVNEFSNLRDYTFFEDSMVPNIVPALNFAADVGGAMWGAKKGFEFGTKLTIPHPAIKSLAVAGTTGIGGIVGSFITGAPARATRASLINSFYSLPPEEIATQMKDLGISMGFSAIPLGTGTPATYKLFNKFSGNEDALQYLINMRGSVDEIIEESAELGIPLTTAEATKIGSKARFIQHYLSQQPEIDKLHAFYGDRASLVRESVELFADRMGSGKTTGDINTRLQETGEWVLNELQKRRKARATKIYDWIKQMPDGVKIPEESMNVMIGKIDDAIAGKIIDKTTGKVIRETSQISPSTIKNLEKFKKMFFDADGNIVDDLASLDQRRTSEMKVLLNKLRNKGTGDFGAIKGLVDDLTAIMDDTLPEYRLARRIYDPMRPSLQAVEKSAIGKFSKLMTDKQTATAMKNLFDPKVSVKSLRNSRRLLQTADPDVWKDVKKEYILQTLDRFSRSGTLEEGLPGFQKYMSQTNTMKMMKEMLEPEEFQTWEKMVNRMGDAFSVHRGGSPTQPFTAFDEAIAQESKKLGVKSTEAIISLFNFIPRIFQARTGEKFTRGVANQQKEAYLRKMTDILLSEDGAKTMDDVLYFFDKHGYRTGQVFTRGAEKFIDKVSETGDQPYTGDIDIPQEEEAQPPTDNLQGAIQSFEVPQINQPLFDDQPDLNPMETLSPTILPNEKDREIALRNSGIARLV